MSIRDLKEKYGGSKGRQVVNRAIRAEIIGGNEALDAVECLRRLHRLGVDRRYPWAADATAALNSVMAIVDEMSEEIARRYDLTSSREEDAGG